MAPVNKNKAQSSEKDGMLLFVNAMKNNGESTAANTSDNELGFFDRKNTQPVVDMYKALLAYRLASKEKDLLVPIPVFNKRGGGKLRFKFQASTVKNLTLLEQILSQTNKKNPKVTESGDYILIQI